MPENATDKRVNPGLFALTRREREVLRLVINGLKNREMAVALKVNIKTVEKHRWHLMLKLDAHNAKTLKQIVADAKQAGVFDKVFPEWRN